MDIPAENKTIIISNCCLGNNIHNVLVKSEYNNPFVATLIPEDSHFLKLCENIIHYMNCEPTCDYNPSNVTDYSVQTKGLWYNNPAVEKKYPRIHLEDVEIHCVHESCINETVTKFKRRMERFRDIIKSNDYKILNIMTWSNLFTIHKNQDYKPYIRKFLSNNNNSNRRFIFLGPPNYVNDPYYIDDTVFNLNIKRRIDNINIQIDFDREKLKIVDFIYNNKDII